MMDQLDAKAKLQSSLSSSSINMVKLDKGTGLFKIPVTDKWTIAGKTQVKIRSSRTTLCILGLLLILVTTGVVLNYRIQKLEKLTLTLESKNLVLSEELHGMHTKLMCIMAKISGGTLHEPDQDENEMRLKFNEYYCSQLDEQFSMLMSDHDENVEPKLEKSSRIKKRVRKSLDYQNDNPSPPLSPMPLTWNASSSVFPTPTGSSQSYRKRGNKSKSKSTLREEILHLKHLRAKLSTLKTKLEIAKTNAKTAKTLLYAYRTQSLLNQSLESQNQTMNENTRTKVPEARAVYLTMRDPNVPILNPKQIIGPWHLSNSGEYLGFNDLWYQNLSLDKENGTSVIFQESGLYLIYAQIFYRSTHSKKDKLAPMGFQIYLKKNNKMSSNSQIFRRPIPIAECVPAFPKIFYATCYTSVAWYVEAGDQIYLEHFTEALPVIEAEKQGQTFLGIVRL